MKALLRCTLATLALLAWLGLDAAADALYPDPAAVGWMSEALSTE